jgi:hypothetical protein
MENENLKEVKDVKPILNNINWSFHPKPPILKNVIQPFNARKYHWYPATYIPEIPYSLIEIFTNQGAKIFDPFMGIGTTFFQSLILKRMCYANDVSKLSHLYVKTLYELFNPSIDLLSINQNIQNEVKNFDTRNCNIDIILQRNSYFGELQKWYSSENFKAICYLTQLKDLHEEGLLKSIYGIIISSLLNSVSNQNRGMSCIADNMLPKPYQVRRGIDVCKIFISNLNRLLTDVYGTRKLLSGYDFGQFYDSIRNERLFYNEDISKICSLEKESIDIVISSPPYPNMIDYTTSQRLGYYFFGYDLNEERKSEIGARYRRSVRNTLSDYFNKMNAANENIVGTIKKNGN